MCRDRQCILKMALPIKCTLDNQCHRTVLVSVIGVIIILIYVVNHNMENNALVNILEKHRQHPPSRHRLQSMQEIFEDKTIHTIEKFKFDFKLGGNLFDEIGASTYIEGNVTTSEVYSFSPYLEREAAKKFLDPPHGNVYFANSPAIMWHKGELILVSRIWLDREKYESDNKWPENNFADNWLYTQKFDHQMRPVNNGSLIGVASPKDGWLGDGPIEPRLFKVNGQVLVTFNAAMTFGPKRKWDVTVMWNYEENKVIIPKIREGSPMINATEHQSMPRDKHWMALVLKRQLYFVHNLDPFMVMHCELSGDCEFVHKAKDKENFIFEPFISHLRGGTPFELYEHPYYIGIAHSTMYKDPEYRRFYTAHMVVVCVTPFRIVYVSNDIEIHPEIYRKTPMVRARYIDDGFIFPVGLILEDSDTLDLGVHVNDHSSVILRLRGLKNIMDNIIYKDKLANPHHGPPVGSIQKHVHDILEKRKHRKFFHYYKNPPNTTGNKTRS